MSRPTIVVEVAFTTSNPLTVPGSWTDISAYVLEDGLSIRRGRQDELKSFSAATASIRLNNADRRFEPLNTSSPYTPNVVPMRRIRIRATWNSITYTLFSGFVTDWRPEYNSDAPVVVVSCIDFIGAYLSRAQISSVAIYDGVWTSAAISTLTPSPAYAANGRAITASAYYTGTYTGIGTLNRSIIVNGTNAVTGLADSETITIGFSVSAVSSAPATATTTKRWTSVTSIVVQSPSTAMINANTLLTVRPDSTYPSEYSGDALTTLLSGNGIASGDRDIGSGASLIQAYTYGSSTLNSLAQKIAASEDGTFYTARDGRVTFRGRYARLSSVALSATFDPTTTLPFASATLSYNDQNIYNVIRISRDGGITQEERDQTSIDAYFTRVYERATLLTADTEADALAQWLLNFYEQPGLRISSLKLSGELAPSTLWPVLLAADINNRYRVVVRPLSGSAITQDVWLEGISITVSSKGWAIDWSLSPGSDALYGFWVLNTSALDSTTKLGY